MTMTHRPRFTDLVLVEGYVVAEAPDGVTIPIEGVLIKSSTGTFTYTDEKGGFKCPVCAEADTYALCAIKSGYQVYVDWGTINPPESRTGLVIPLKIGPEGTECQLLKLPSGPGCCTGKVTDSVTGRPIPGALVAIDGGPPSTTNRSGVYGCKCATAGDHQLCVSAPKHQTKCITITLPLGKTITVNIALDPLPKS
jgi:hypothetical protein